MSPLGLFDLGLFMWILHYDFLNFISSQRRVDKLSNSNLLELTNSPILKLPKNAQLQMAQKLTPSSKTLDFDLRDFKILKVTGCLWLCEIFRM